MSEETRLKALGYKVMKDNSGAISVTVAVKRKEAILILGYNYRKIKFKCNLGKSTAEDVDFISCYNTPDIYNIRLCCDLKDGCWNTEKELLYIKKDKLLVTRDNVVDRGDFLLYKARWDDGRLEDWIYDIKKDVVYVIDRSKIWEKHSRAYYEIVIENGILMIGSGDSWQEIRDYEERKDLANNFVIRGEEM